MRKLYADIPQGSRRYLLSRHLLGSGLEIGPGHHPYRLAEGATVKYIDRWTPAEASELFPEISDGFVEPDYIADFNVEGLAPVADESQDFVIASHVLEHVANPLRMLSEIHRVVRPGGAVLILLPDRRRIRTDSRRPPTPLQHVVDDYAAGVTELSLDHILEEVAASGIAIPSSAADRAELVRWHQLRSVHAHCWNEAEFADLVHYSIGTLGLAFELVDAVSADETQFGEANIEYGFVLRRCPLAMPPAQLARRWQSFFAEWQVQDRTARAAGRRALWMVMRSPMVLGTVRRVKAFAGRSSAESGADPASPR